MNNFNKALFLLLIAGLTAISLSETLPKSLFDTKEERIDTNLVQDSLMLHAIKQEKDSLKKAKKVKTKPKPKPIKNYASNLKLDRFYKQLYRLEKEQRGTVRIAYYGDSMNDGDLVVQDIRKLYQKKYGGKGVGFVSLCSKSAKGRASISHQFSNQLTHYSFTQLNKEVALGISGDVSLGLDSLFVNNWVSYGTGYYPTKNKLYQPTLFYGKLDSIESHIYVNDTINPIKLTGKSSLNTYKISKKTINKLKIYFQTHQTPIYGINFDNHQGVHVDNFSARGNSGLPLSYLHRELMSQFQKELDYDLIIMQFGTNIISHKTKEYSWYKRSMKRMINQLKKDFPKVDLLTLSVADKARKYGTEMKTDSAVYAVIETQHQFTKDTETGFLNLFKLMGGENSMVKWVEKPPRLANRDYTHFNAKGSKEIALLIFNELEKGYKKYKKEHIKTQIDEQKNVK
jgi:lysophospholipase L1-like esterase